MTDGGRFPRCARLTGRQAFAQVFAQPIKSGDRYFTVLARPNALAYPRLGLAISRKAAKLAVVRNRVKRIARESFRLHQTQLGGADYVVLGRIGLAEPANPVLFASLAQHWRRLSRSCAGS